MKYKTTQKEVKAGYDRVLSVGYCTLQHLLNYKAPVAYTTRREGWGSDIYELTPGIAISTGYAPFGKGKQIPYETLRKYDDKAMKLLYDRYRRLTRHEIADLIDELILEFIEEVEAE